MTFNHYDCCLFTIASKNYLPFVRVLLKSFLSFHSGIKTFALLSDKIDGYFDPAKEPFEIIEADSIGIKDFDSFSFKYNIVEFNTAVKPFFFEYLFSRYKFKKIIYLDPDIVVFRSLSEIFEALDSYSVVLTPHIMSPLPDDGCSPKDIDILKVGCFNLGFIGLSQTTNTARFLSWWKDRLYDKCLQAPFSGYAVDQIWPALVPCFFDDYLILRKPGYNVAYWNLHERNLTKEGGEYFINETPLHFFHFSGFDPDNLNTVSKYQNRFELINFAVLAELFETYKDLLIKEEYYKSKHWPYHYGFFSNGSRISELARGIYWGLGISSETLSNPYYGFYRRLCRVLRFKSMFSERFLRAMGDKFLLFVWKSMLKRKKIPQ